MISGKFTSPQMGYNMLDQDQPIVEELPVPFHNEVNIGEMTIESQNLDGSELEESVFLVSKNNKTGKVSRSPVKPTRESALNLVMVSNENLNKPSAGNYAQIDHLKFDTPTHVQESERR